MYFHCLSIKQLISPWNNDLFPTQGNRRKKKSKNQQNFMNTNKISKLTHMYSNYLHI